MTFHLWPLTVYRDLSNISHLCDNSHLAVFSKQTASAWKGLIFTSQSGQILQPIYHNVVGFRSVDNNAIHVVLSWYIAACEPLSLILITRVQLPVQLLYHCCPITLISTAKCSYATTHHRHIIMLVPGTHSNLHKTNYRVKIIGNMAWTGIWSSLTAEVLDLIQRRGLVAGAHGTHTSWNPFQRRSHPVPCSVTLRSLCKILFAALGADPESLDSDTDQIFFFNFLVQNCAFWSSLTLTHNLTVQNSFKFSSKCLCPLAAPCKVCGPPAIAGAAGP